MNKKLIIGGAVAAIIAASGVTYATVNKDTCNYDPKTGNYWDGKQWSAYGGWDEAIACAKEGVLPQVVADRLGVWGDKKTQAEGRKYAKINAEVKAAKEKAKKEAEAKAAAEAAKAKESK